jgi:thioredoxin 2
MSDKIHLVCQHCDTINAVPSGRLGDKPLCAHCKQPLFSGQPIEVNSGQLERHIQKSGLPVLVDFWASWCGPCKSFAPVYQEYAKVAAGKLRLLKLDTEANQQAGAKHAIRSIPTLALFRNGQEVTRISGALSLSQLQQWVTQQLNPN